MFTDILVCYFPSNLFVIFIYICYFHIHLFINLCTQVGTDTVLGPG